MRWTQCLMVFGLAALLTFQVEQSSAATLRNAVAYSEVDEALSVELNDERDAREVFRDIAKEIKERLHGYGENIRKAMEMVKQQGPGTITKDEAERIQQHLAQILESAKEVDGKAKKLEAIIGKTGLAKEARKVMKQAEEAIEKMKALKTKPAADEDEELLADGDLAQRLKERVEKVREAIRKELEKVKAMSKPLAERVKARFEKIREAAKKLAEKFGETQVGAAAKKLAKEAEEAIQKIKEAIKGKPAEPTKPTPDAEEDEELLAAEDKDLAQRMKERIDKVRELIRKEFEKVKGMSKAAAERVQARFEMVREQAKKLAERFGETQVGAAAKKLAKEAAEAIQKIKEAIKGKLTEPTKPTPAAEEDEELLADGDKNLAQRMKERIDKVRELIRKEFEKVKGMSKAAAEKVQARFETIRAGAQALADKLKQTEIGAAAQKLAKETEAAIQKIKEAIKGKPAEPTKPSGEEDEELLADGPLTDLQKRIQERIEKMREAIRAEVDRLAGLPKEAVERLRARIERIREAAKRVADFLGETVVGLAAKRVVSEADAFLNKIKESLKKKPAAPATSVQPAKPTEPAKPAGEEEEEMLLDVLDVIKERVIDDMRASIRAVVDKLAGLPKEAVERARARIEKMRETARRIAESLGDTVLGTAAKRVRQEADAALNKIKEKLKSKTATTPAEPKPTTPAAPKPTAAAA